MPDLRISQIAELTCLSKRYWQRMVMDGKVPGAAFIQMGERRTYIVDADKFLPLDKGLSEIVERIAPEMTKPKLTTAIATEMVDRIEKIKNDSDAAILAIYIDARDNYAGVNNDSVISDAVKARRDLREAEFMASSLLASFDAED